MPQCWQGRRDHEQVGRRLCTGLRRQYTMPWGWRDRRFHDPVSYRLWSDPRWRTAMPNED